ncbi:MAG: single-stranded-DNA-specific exonuclease RecJ [Pseudomonadota bacterium]
MTAAAPLIADDALFGVARSVTGKRWTLASADPAAAARIAAATGVEDVVARILAGRGVRAAEAAAFLEPRLRDALPDPCVMRDMEAAADRIARAVASGETIAVFGDYDVDGVSASALLHRWLSAVGAPPRVHLPDRMTEGYGPSVATFRRLAEEGASLIITVDCGASAFAPIEAANAASADVVVLDHHQMGAERPPAAALVNPNQPGCGAGLGDLSAAGVAFMAAVATTRALRAVGFFANRDEPDLLSLLDLAALGLVCDVMPMTGLARTLVAQGLKVMAARRSPGVAALVDAGAGDRAPTAHDVGFGLGPRINAAGRIAHPKLAFDLLIAEDPAAAARALARLDALNTERRALEAAATDAATGQIEARGERSVAFASAEGWHPGVVGIVAGRLRERFARPALAVSILDGVGRGSGRSVPGVDLGAAVRAAAEAGLLEAGGGHAQAAGFTVAPERIDAFAAFMEREVERQTPGGPPVEQLSIDATARLGAVNAGTAEAIAPIGPFGPGNQEPVFAFETVRLERLDVRGGRHLALRLAGANGDASARAVAFRAVGEPLGDFLEARVERPIHVAGVVRADTWRGGSAGEIHLVDAAPAH